MRCAPGVNSVSLGNGKWRYFPAGMAGFDVVINECTDGFGGEQCAEF
jgi:hypothetical protein